MSFEHWTPGQWTAFTVTLAVGLVAAAVLLLAGRARYVPPGLNLPDIRRVPRPSIVMTERRQRVHDCNTHEPYARIGASRNVPVIAGELPGWVDPTVADFTDPGIGALSSIQAIGVDPTLRTEAEISAELDAWINAYADLSGLMPETAAAAETMRCNLEPVLRKAHLWRIRGEGGSARQALNDWRIGTKTGEYPMITTADLRPYAVALLGLG
jgi:hypothetical protein